MKRWLDVDSWQATRLRLLGGAWALALATLAAPARATDVAVWPMSVEQRISGFGASSAWTAGAVSDGDADLLFSVEQGAGLSLLRVRIAPDGTCGEVVTAQKAVSRGASVWATPWSPDPTMKTNGSVDNGSLLASAADAWAASLASFVQGMQLQGVPISYLSAQNEPDSSRLSYESCEYTPEQMTDFIANHLAPAMSSASVAAKVIAPETQGWDDLGAYGGAILGNADAAAAVGVVATHEYNGSPYMFGSAGKELWETEYYDQTTGSEDPGIGSALVVASAMHAALVYANVNAWHYWWIYSQGNDNAALWDGADAATRSPSKRLYVMGNFSRFVRPGFYRIGATTTAPNPGVLVSAYYDSPSHALVLVAINSNTAPVSQAFLFDRVATGSWASWVTSAAESLSAGAPVDPSSTPGRLVYSLEPESVTTLTGVVTGPGPALPDPSPTSVDSSAPGAAGCACSAVRDRRKGGGVAWALGATLLAAREHRRRKRRAVDGPR